MYISLKYSSWINCSEFRFQIFLSWNHNKIYTKKNKKPVRSQIFCVLHSTTGRSENLSRLLWQNSAKWIISCLYMLYVQYVLNNCNHILGEMLSMTSSCRDTSYVVITNYLRFLTISLLNCVIIQNNRLVVWMKSSAIVKAIFFQWPRYSPSVY